MKPLSALLALFSLCLYLFLVIGPAKGSTATDTEKSTLTLTIQPAVEIEVIKADPLVDVDQASASFSINLWANTAWAISEPTISSGLVDDGSCVASQLRGSRNLDNRPQEIGVVCLQPMSWANDSGAYEVTLDQVIASTLTE